MREGSEPLPFGWDELVPLLVHPLRVAIIEALRHIGQPLSTADLQAIIGEDCPRSVVSYHLATLANVGAVVEVEQSPVAAAERFYVLPSEAAAAA